MTDDYVAEVDTWVVCYNADQSVHHFIAMADGQHLATRIENIEAFTDYDQAVARYQEINPGWVPDEEML